MIDIANGLIVGLVTSCIILAIFVQGLEKRVAKLEKEFPSVASPEPTDKES